MKKIEQEVIELNQKRQSEQDEILNLKMQLEAEKKKLPTIEIREKEIIKIEEKCRKCSKTEYQTKLISLHGLTVGALVYGILITVISAAQNNLLINDCKSFCLQVQGFIEYILKSVNKWVIGVSNGLCNKCLYYILWIMIVAIIAYLAYRTILILKNKSWTFWNPYTYSILLFDLVFVVFGGEYIKRMFEVNLIWLAISLYCAYMIIRGIYEIRRFVC